MVISLVITCLLSGGSTGIVILPRLNVLLSKPALDGFYTGALVEGCFVLCEIFDPPWWRVDRWIDWWLCKRNHPRSSTIVTVSSWDYTVRVRELHPFDKSTP